MGQISMKIISLPGSLLSANQHGGPQWVVDSFPAKADYTSVVPSCQNRWIAVDRPVFASLMWLKLLLLR